ncbi:MAG: hypothetical protein LBC84_03125, partial [Prevotellaceae bacterium]|nr:hypothetical protein [Prevotellaceae bacterium]
MSKLLLIDGHALIYRAYYAFIRRNLINSKGEDMSAVFGFAKTLIDLIIKEKPTHLAVGLDPGGKTFRHDLFPQYKANRDKTPEVIIASIPVIKKILNAFHIPIYMLDGYEADDVLGTIAKGAEKEGLSVYMVTSDKDYGQLISPNIWQCKPGRSGDEWELLGVKEICDKYSIERPEQLIDILSIQGDVSDNVPGVPGIGEVGAKKLIEQYKSVENLLLHLHELPQKYRNTIHDHVAQLSLSKELVTINTSVPVEWNKDDFQIGAPNLVEVEQLFKEYEFYSLLQSLPRLQTLFCPDRLDIFANDLPKSVVPPYTITEKSLLEVFKEEELSIVPLFSSFNIDKLQSIAVCNKELVVHWFPCVSDQEIAALKEWLQSPQTALTGHGLKPLLHFLYCNGIEVNGTVYDTEVLHYLLNPERSHKWEVIAKSVLQFDPPKEEAKPIRQCSLFDEVEETSLPSDEQRATCCAAAYAAMAIRPILWEEIKEKDMTLLYTQVEMPLTPVLVQMEAEGIKLDTPRLKRYGNECLLELNALSQQIRDLCGDRTLNISSPKQLGIVLFEKLKLDPNAKLTPGKQYATDEETLLSLESKHPIIPLLLEYRSL